MAPKKRTAADLVALEQRLQREPYKFDFYQAVRLLECAYWQKPKIGYSSRRADDAVRLVQKASMAFAPSTIATFEPTREGRTSRLEVLFFGLFGPNGPLPLHLTEFARERERNHEDLTFSRFADIFHHRLLAFFYRSWADAQPTVSLDRPKKDRFALYVGSVFGMGQSSLLDRDALPDPAKLFHAGLLACQTRHGDGLRAILENFFEVPVQIEQFIGQWTDIPDACRLRLGESPETGCLGIGTVLGEQVWNSQQRFRIVLGPLGLEDYKRFLPGSATLRRVTDLVRHYTGGELEWDMNPVLSGDTVPPLRLGGVEQLGLTTWMTSSRTSRNQADLILQPAYEQGLAGEDREDQTTGPR